MLVSIYMYLCHCVYFVPAATRVRGSSVLGTRTRDAAAVGPWTVASEEQYSVQTAEAKAAVSMYST